MEEFFEDIEEGEPSNVVENESVSSGKQEARAKPSGSGFTFFMDDVDDEDDDETMEDYNVNDSLNNPSTSKEIIKKSLETNQDQDYQKELTERYMSGKMSFKDYMKQLDNESDDESDEDEDIPKAPGESDDSNLSWTTEASKQTHQNLNEKEMEAFSEELAHTTKQQLGRKKSRLGMKRTAKKIDPTLQGLIGEANLRFARGDSETAIKMCMEVITHDPRAHEPFQTLSTIFEESGEFEKAVQFAMIGAHLAPPEPDEWERLANMSLELQDPTQAASCLKKAIDCDTSNIRLHVTRCHLLEEIGEKKMALRGYKRLMNALGNDNAEDYMNACQESARLLHERGDLEAARNVLQAGLEKHKDYDQLGFVNLLLELLLHLKEHPQALNLLCKKCHAKFSSDKKAEEVQSLNHEDQLQLFTKISLPPETPFEIKRNLIVVLVNLNATHLVTEYSKELLDCEPSDYGDLMLDVCEAFMGQKCWNQALEYSEKLVKSESYSNAAAVWLQYGECLFETQKLTEAEVAYKKVVELAPQHFDARRALSNVLHKLGRSDEAIHILTQDEKAELLNPSMLYERCMLLLTEGHTDEFIKKSRLLFSRHFETIRTREEVLAMCLSRKHSRERIKELRSSSNKSNIDYEEATFDEEESNILVSDEYQLFRTVCDVLYKEKRYTELQRMAYQALGSKRFYKDVEILKDLEILAMFSSFLNKDSHFAYNYIRDMVVKDPKNNKLWNLFNIIITDSDDTRHTKFLMRLSKKCPDDVAIGILNGNNCLQAGTYKYSLGEYINVFKLERNNPLIPLMLGITFVHLACQKFSSRKHSLLVQGCAFLQNYLKMRGPCQESYYNLGRAMQQLGILPAAILHYKNALELEPSLDEDAFDLRREAAFNLSLMYKSSGSHDLAKSIIDKYIVI